MKSIKFYFSLFLSVAMLAQAVPAMAENGELQEENVNASEGVMLINETPEQAVEEIACDQDEVQVPADKQSDEALAASEKNAIFDAEFAEGGIAKTIDKFIGDTGIAKFAGDEQIANDTDPLTNTVDWRCAVMLLISFVLLYLAIVKKFEPLLLMPIAFGMMLTNLPGADMFHADLFAGGHIDWSSFAGGHVGLLDILYLGVKLGIYPCLVP